MNRKGIFITFMVFLIVASILAANEAGKKIDYRQEQKHIDDMAFNTVNNAFNNFYEEVVSLNKEGMARIIQQRPMPFEYDLNGNSIILHQRIPVMESTIRSYIDALNIYSIFINYSAEEDLDIYTETVKNTAWGGTMNPPDLNYAILPQCLLYDINGCCNDVNLMAFKALANGENNCVGGFNYGDFNVVDINILLNSSGCTTGSIAGNLGGKKQIFDPLSPYPYFKIVINEINPFCPGTGCKITANGMEERYGHFNPETFAPATEIDSLLVNCDAQEWIRAKLGKESAGDAFPLAVYNKIRNRPVEVDLNLTFDKPVKLFYFTGFSISVGKKNFSIKRNT